MCTRCRWQPPRGSGAIEIKYDPTGAAGDDERPQRSAFALAQTDGLMETAYDLRGPAGEGSAVLGTVIAAAIGVVSGLVKMH